jgi:hypothetical protein
MLTFLLFILFIKPGPLGEVRVHRPCHMNEIFRSCLSSQGHIYWLDSLRSLRCPVEFFLRYGLSKTGTTSLRLGLAHFTPLGDPANKTAGKPKPSPLDPDFY